MGEEGGLGVAYLVAITLVSALALVSLLPKPLQSRLLLPSVSRLALQSL